MMVAKSYSMNEADSAAAAENVADFFGPHQVDQSVRQALQVCWMSLPKERRTSKELEKQIRRLVARALKDFREDRKAFGLEAHA
jgi:hypothetical protein